MIRYISELNREQLNGKKVLLRVDFNVALSQLSAVNNQPPTFKIAEGFRIKSHKETIDYLTGNGAKVMLVAHISQINSFLPIVENIGEILGQTLTLVPLEHISDSGKLFSASSVLLLDNIRQDPGEEKNSDELANKLVQGFDLYVNDAFSVSHRKHASVSAVAGKLPAYGGLLIKKEIEGLSKALNAPVQGKTVILGGAKIATKLPVIENFLDKAEKILVGGAIANNFFKANGINVGASLVDDGTLSIKNLDMNKIVLPVDALVSDDKGGNGNVRSVDLKNPDISAQESILDIGKETIFNFSEIINSSVMVVWNGPMGLNEVERFKNGTNIIAEAVSKVGYSVIGGGDTVAALPEVLKSKFTFISTGGGAMLDFLAGKTMPGLVALGYQE